MSGGAATGDGRKDTSEQAEFRAYCKEWLSNNLPSPPTVRLPQSPLEIMTTDQLEYLCAWQKSAYDAGLVGCDYPEAHGGSGRKDCQRIANQEMQSVATPYLPNVIGLGMAAPTIYFHAQEPLKERVLPKLLSGEEIWCQGFQNLVQVLIWPVCKPLPKRTAITGLSMAIRFGRLLRTLPLG